VPEKTTDLTQVSPLTFPLLVIVPTLVKTRPMVGTIPPHERRREAELPEVYRLIERAVKSLLAMFSLLNLRFT